MSIAVNSHFSHTYTHAHMQMQVFLLCTMWHRMKMLCCGFNMSALEKEEDVLSWCWQKDKKLFS